MAEPQTLLNQIQDRFSDFIDRVFIARDDTVTVELSPHHLLSIAEKCRDDAQFRFEQLIDLCGVDYLTYGQSEWRTQETTGSGFSRGVSAESRTPEMGENKPRFAVVSHLLSLSHNHRLRLRVNVDGEPPVLPSLVNIWPSVNWFEREAFDLYGIVFDGHPDLRRLLTDYGFVGHPFRKDFPLIGEVALRYDAATERCVYEPVDIQERVLVPKVIRQDNRYRGNNG